MKLVERMSIWLKAEGHGVVDAIEDRELLLKQAIREAELALDAKRADARLSKARLKRNTDALEQMRSEEQRLDADVKLALQEEHDDLARFAVRRLLPLRRRIDEVERTIRNATKQLEQLEETVRTQSTEFDAFKVRVRDAIEYAKSQDAEFPVDSVVSDEEVEIELLRRKRTQETS